MGHPMTFQKNRMAHKLLTTIFCYPRCLQYLFCVNIFCIKGTFVRVHGKLKNKCTGSCSISVPSRSVRKQPRSKYLKQFKMNLNAF